MGGTSESCAGSSGVLAQRSRRPAEHPMALCLVSTLALNYLPGCSQVGRRPHRGLDLDRESETAEKSKTKWRFQG